MTDVLVVGTLVRPGASPSTNITVSAPPWLQREGQNLQCLARYELFFPMGYGLLYKPEIEAAKAICAVCPVRELCLAWAVPQPNLDGIWGAMTPPERRRVRTGKAV